jgi:acyl-homoserine lactone acylase PvdQ
VTSTSRARWLVALLLVAPWAALPFGASAQGADFATHAYDVLPPGEAGDIPATRHSLDQIRLYDRLAPKLGNLRMRDLRRYFKQAPLGLAGQRPQRVERPGRRGLRILRDRWGVPHVSGATRSAVMFGSGWVAAEDRGTLMEVLRGPASIAALDVPGLGAVTLALSLRRFEPSAETRRFLAHQVSLLRRRGRKGARVVADFQAYVAGINAYNRANARPVKRWRVTDVVAVASLIGAVFGKGGGDEARRSELLSALQRRLGAAPGEQVWQDLRELRDPEAPVTVARPFAYGHALDVRPGNAVIDAGSLAGAAAASAASRPLPAEASNALLVSARRSTTRHPLFVAGPQVGYFYPQILMEVDLHGGGIRARGATFAGAAPYVLIGRGIDFAWSATSAGSDVVDQYVETLCGNDTTYRYKGRCVPMRTFDAGVLGAGGGKPRTQVSFRQTVHGPVIGYATVGGRRVAISQRRSTRGREAFNGLPFAALNQNLVHTPRDFIRTMAGVEFTFNWFYADFRHIAMYSSGRLPIRAPGVDPGLPTIGTGEYEWRHFLPRRRHPQVIDPRNGLIVNWNNEPARAFGASDSNWSYGSIHRSELLTQALARHRRQTLASVVAAMNRAATQDLRHALILPSIAAVLDTGPAPSPRDARMLTLLRNWRRAGSSRIDRNLDGQIDAPGAAIIDAAWPRIADAVMSPVLGPQLDDLAALVARDENARSLGSSYDSGWYGYVDKDLRTVRGGTVSAPFRTRFCGLGVLSTCRAALWAALDAAGNELAATQGARPDAWRADATRERIVFQPGLLGARHQMRWTNRPTFQQVISFDSHRRR